MFVYQVLRLDHVNDSLWYYQGYVLFAIHCIILLNSYRPEEFYSEKKFIVSLSSLHSLISSCTECGKETKYVNTVNQGAYSEFEIVCHYCTAIRTWSTTSKINQYPAINHFISGSILFTGAPATKVLRVLDFIGLTAPSYQNYISIQRNYLFGVSPQENKWDIH